MCDARVGVAISEIDWYNIYKDVCHESRSLHSALRPLSFRFARQRLSRALRNLGGTRIASGGARYLASGLRVRTRAGAALGPPVTVVGVFG